MRLYKLFPILLSLCVFFLPGRADAAVPGFSYYKPITITNSSGSALVNYQVKITVAYNSHMQSDFDDLRFTASDGSTLLDYWVESYTASTSATVWVEVNSAPAGNSTIYMYYGNSTAGSLSNIKTTFVLGDDFNDGSIDTNLWDKYNGGGISITETGGELKISGTSNYNYYYWNYLESKSQFTQSVVVDLK